MEFYFPTVRCKDPVRGWVHAHKYSISMYIGHDLVQKVSFEVLYSVHASTPSYSIYTVVIISKFMPHNFVHVWSNVCVLIKMQY